VVEYGRLYEVVQAAAAAEAVGEAEAAVHAHAQALEEEETAPPAPAMTDTPADPPDDDEGETLLDDEADGNDEDGDDEDGDDDDDDESDVDDDDEGTTAGRTGLERVFSRLVMIRRVDLAFLVLDDLGGELSDERTRATYTIFHGGDGLPAILVDHWEAGKREILEPGAPKDGAGTRSGGTEVT
jgi:hypothetical protein